MTDTTETLEERMAHVAKRAAQQNPDHWAPGDPSRETPEQIIVRMRLDPADIQTPAIVSRQIRYQEARSRVAAEEKRWADMDARVTALEQGQGLTPPVRHSTGRISAP